MNDMESRTKLVGWEAIANYTGYGVRQLQKFEKEKGLIIFRMTHGKQNRVWAYKNDVDTFLTNYFAKGDPSTVHEPGFSNSLVCSESVPAPTPNVPETESFQDREPESKKTDPPRVGKRHLLFAALALLSITLVGLVLWSHYPVNRGKELGGFELLSNSSGLTHYLKITNAEGTSSRKIWQSANGKGLAYADHLRNVYLREQVALSATNRSARLLAECLDYKLRAHTMEMSWDVPIPLLTVTNELGEQIDDLIKVNGLTWVDTKIFKGWAVVYISATQFPGCLVLYDPDLKEPKIRGKLFNPGHLRHMVVEGESLVITGALNARENRFDKWVGAVIRVEIASFLDRRVQLKPFSPRSIPSKQRRRYYSLKDMPNISGCVYLTFDRHRLIMPMLWKRYSNLEVTLGYDPSRRIKVIFDQNLVWKQKLLDEHHFDRALDPDAEYFATRFRYWEGDQWGLWQAERQ